MSCEAPGVQHWPYLQPRIPIAKLGLNICNPECDTSNPLPPGVSAAGFSGVWNPSGASNPNDVAAPGNRCIASLLPRNYNNTIFRQYGTTPELKVDRLIPACWIDMPEGF
eukprot:NODE_11758_length_434_cov_11.006431_g11102_i0.p1 GENE.NODE_11758_length_434_cov_11.006431_g11102_i0~~NODE_11758_length_434_cov_11.006431_g11102_i0.p1  ORF type:complete len:110 (+),score=15.53 NODE_11758_length_434_cov_11.006431_g11102_i0:57-386(+)